MGACAKFIICVIVFFVLLFLAIFLPQCFQYVEYYEYGLLQQRSTGELDRENVYTNTRIIRGPDFEMEEYTATSHHVRFNNLAIATFDRVGIELSVSFQYFLRKEDIVLLNDEFQDGYKSVVIDRATDAMKAKAPSFNVRQYIDNRTLIEEELFLAIRRRVEGSCCYQACQDRGTCLSGCKPMGSCRISEMGVFVEVRYFQLLSVSIHQSIAERFLRSLLLQEKALKSELQQTAILLRKETDTLVQAIKNEADEIKVASETEARLIQTEAQANKSAIIESARRTGLLGLYDRLNIRDEKHRNTFDYLRTLRHEERCHLTVDYQQRIATNIG